MLDALKSKTVLVTGHTGFKGSWLCLWLHRMGAHVHGISLAPPTTPNNFTVSKVQDVLQSHTLGDIRDTQRLVGLIRDTKPDLIMHLAAQSVVREGYRDPIETFSTNVMGTASVLEAIRQTQHACSALMVTSDKCYENREQVWGYRECDPMGEHDPYGCSKGAAELVVRSYRDSFFPSSRLSSHGIKIASARAGNVVGGGDWTAHALIVDIVKALDAGKAVEIRSPDAHRPWQHVLQALSGYLTICDKLLNSEEPRYCSGWNIGPLPGNEIPVRQIVGLFLKEWGSGTWVDVSDPNAPHEAGILRLSIDKALWELGWKPAWDVVDTIRQTAKWYRQFQQNRENMMDFSMMQIAEFENAMRQRMASIDS